MKQRFFICDRCGNIVAFVKESGVDVVCCEEFMKELVPHTVDVSSEKHAPVYTVENGVVEVSVGALPHPMSEEHHIEWISCDPSSAISARNCVRRENRRSGLP